MVSVVIPTYNRRDTIENAVRSVLGQTYTDLEVIVVDDCSSDDTREVVTLINDSRVRYIRLPERSGACVARNTGVIAAGGEYVAFQDSDDTWREDKLQVQLSAMEKSGADVCFCRFMKHNYDHEDGVFPGIKAGFVDYKKLLGSSLVSTQTILAKREVFTEDTMFDPGLKKRQDFDWVVRAGRDNKFYLTDEVLCDVYLREDSITNLSAEKSLAAFEYLYGKYPDVCKEYPEFEIALLRKIGYFKTFSGKKAFLEYKRIFKLEKSGKSFVQMILAGMGLMKKFYREG